MVNDTSLGNNTLEICDLSKARVVQSIAGLKEPQGVAYVRETGKLFVATGGDGKCYVFSGDSAMGRPDSYWQLPPVEPYILAVD